MRASLLQLAGLTLGTVIAFTVHWKLGVGAVAGDLVCVGLALEER